MIDFVGEGFGILAQFNHVTCVKDICLSTCLGDLYYGDIYNIFIYINHRLIESCRTYCLTCNDCNKGTFSC